ncbi:hypothetical protein AKJ09_04411 [Labilithrix luteola]|uniref:BNR repeat domain protein n=1 Tax=Labilithrix luteola TaxID=1391654 RepID=A0A0K1PW58_9BACT|nr:hypothetical protein [Labilithrix luteola]AKU97747.1 hypothetical protein AKJ09_04411 [Labilithrix luteola]
MACSSDDSPRGFEEASASDSGASLPSTDAGTTDATTTPATDASTADAAKFDASALPISCENGASCATAITTTLAEGFCVILQDATVACWGENMHYELGRGADAGISDSANPARVEGLANIVTLEHSCAVDKDGGAWCWGLGPWLRSTTAFVTAESAPVKLDIPPAKKVSAALFSETKGAACALFDTGVSCWGSNDNAQVAPSDTLTTPNATQAVTPVALGSSSPVRDLTVGYASFAIHEDGTVSSWGNNPTIGRVSSLFPDAYPRTIPLSDVTMVSAPYGDICALSNGVPYCWGDPRGSLGDILERALPSPVVFPSGVTQIASTSRSAGNFSYPVRVCAIDEKGDLLCWGNNSKGQVGDGTTTYALEPVKVSLPAPAARVSTTSTATCAILTNGKVYCWGDNAQGQLGNGQLRVPSRVPQEVVLP